MSKNDLYIILFFLLAFLLLFFRLGNTSLVNWDEAWLASVSQDIATRGDWLGGRWNGQTWFYEPPLVTWVLATLYKIFGPSEFWLRSFNALLGLLIVVVTYKLSIVVTKSKLAALISAIILLSDIEFLFRSRQINVEIPVTFFLLLTIYTALKTLSSPQRKWWIITGISVGLAFLTKRASPILVLPAFLPLYRSLRAKGRLASRSVAIPSFKNVIFMLFAFIAVAIPWYLINYLRWGNQFINEFFIGYTLGKIRSINPGTGTNVFFYAEALKHAFKFWFPIIPIAIIWATIKSFSDRKIAILTIYILSFLIFLTLASIKSSWFLLPIHPTLAIIIGVFITNVIPDGAKRRSGMILILAITISIWQLWSYRRDFIVPDTTGHQAALAKLAGQLSEPQNPIYLDDDYLPVAVFYSQSRVLPLRFNRSQSITPLSIYSGTYILTNKETFPTLTQQYGYFSLITSSSDLLLVRL